MLDQFLKFIKTERLFSTKDNILLAVSGGVDSMVMAELFRLANFNFGIAHCNFQLRGKASNADAKLVKTLAENWEVPFHAIRFDTLKESKRQQKSVELVARDLRYEWFEELLQSFDYQYIATAHHLNDSLETLLYNLAKGTGIRGLHGIPIKNERIVRPLSNFSKETILQYAAEAGIPFREDASNQSVEHHRNLIRHEVIPPLKNINPSLEQTFSKTLTQIKETEALFLWAVEEHKRRLIKEEGDLLKINIATLKRTVARSTVLYEIIKDFGFNAAHVEQIFRAIDNVGAQFYSKSHLILIERQGILIKRKRARSLVFLQIEMLPEKVSLPKGKLTTSLLNIKPTELNLGKGVAMIDLAKISLPLTVRNWKEGDRFQPLGMKGRSKKVKDFLRDQKVSRIDKDTVYVLESGGEIVWLIGYRADERFKITAETSEILKIEYHS